MGAVRVDPAHPADCLEGQVVVGVEVVRLNDVAVSRALDAHTGFHWKKVGRLWVRGTMDPCIHWAL